MLISFEYENQVTTVAQEVAEIYEHTRNPERLAEVIYGMTNIHVNASMVGDTLRFVVSLDYNNKVLILSYNNTEFMTYEFKKRGFNSGWFVLVLYDILREINSYGEYLDVFTQDEIESFPK